jgi:predicted Zn-dependent protease with MMP-like domain
MTEPRKWERARAPTISEFETLAADAWQRLPSEFRDKAKDVLIRVEEFGTDEVLDSLSVNSPYDLLGL